MTETGVQPTTYLLYKGNEATHVETAVIQEGMSCISVNGRELATFMCTPLALDELALGFLRSEQLIQTLDDIEILHLAANNSCVDVWLSDTSIELPTRGIITSGCGGGITFDDMTGRHDPLDSTVKISPRQVAALMKELHVSAKLYNQVRGVHTSALTDGDELLLVAQDVGRHNTIDRLWGQALQRNMDVADHILLASGRISSEMLNKAAKMRLPIVISRTSPTSLSVELARAWNITIIGYARGNSFRVYTAPERIWSDEW